MANNDLFTSLISDIKSYSGKDPLLPWLRGIRRLQDSLPQKILEAKLPRFLQKCSQSFQSDDRYRNEPRYLRVWLKLMDFVDDPKELLRTMEANRIGTKHPLFYQAYALYYEKNKKFEEAEKMYHLGVQNHAEPIGELEKAYEQFLQRMEKHRKRNNQEKRTTKRVSDRSRISRFNGDRNNENVCRIGVRPTEARHDGPRSKQQVTAAGGSDEQRMLCSDDTVVGKFVDTAIVGKPESEDACHHGLVDPTINMKEAMSAINSMFREPLEMAPVRRGSNQCQRKENNPDNGFQVFVDENLDNGGESKDKKKESGIPMVQHSRTATHQSHREPLNIFIDDDQDSLEQSEVQNSTEDKKKESGIPMVQHSRTATHQSHREPLNIFIDDDQDSLEQSEVQNSTEDKKKESGIPMVQHSRTATHQSHREPLNIFIDDDQDSLEQSEVQNSTEDSPPSASHGSVFVFLNPKDLPSESPDGLDVEGSSRPRFREDTMMVRRIVGSTISEDPQVENACHHGLVEPTINLKEAMDDINNMFGKPIDFVRSRRVKRQDKGPEKKKDLGGFCILPDDDDDDDNNLEHQQVQKMTDIPGKSKDSDLFETTVLTKEAMDDINKMFGMPLDF